MIVTLVPPSPCHDQEFHSVTLHPRSLPVVGPVKESETAPAPTLPAELVQILVELSNSLNKHTMYPAGHPMLVGAADNFLGLLNKLFETRAALALGVSPSQLIAGGIATDPSHIILRELAARLHRRNIGAIKFYRGVHRDELVEALLFLSAEDRLQEGESARRWAHIRLHPLSYSALELIGEGGQAGGSSWAAKLWLDLSRAALERADMVEGATDPAGMARAIDARQWDDQYGQRIAETLTDLMEACRARGGAEAIALQSQISRLISSMSPETLERLVMLERNEVERQRFLLEIAQSMAVDAVMDLVQAASRATGRSISPALVQLLEKLGEHSRQGSEATRERAEFAFRNQVRELITGWEDYESRDPAPRDHQRTLAHLHLAGMSPLRGHSSTYECEPERILAMSLELGTANQSTYAAAAYLIHQGKTARLKDYFARSPSPGLAGEILNAVATPESFRALLGRDPLDMSGLELLVPLLAEGAMGPLLDALAAAEPPERRDQLIRILVPFGETAGAEALTRLEGAEWAAQRNLLTLITRMPAPPRGFSPALFIDHAEPKVRSEALRILFRGPATRTRAICEALSAKDPGTVRLGVFAAAEDCPVAAVPLLIPLVERSAFEPGIKATAIQALAPVPQPLVLECLVGLCLIRGRWFRRSRIAGKSPLVLAALTGLNRYWADHSRAQEPLALAAGHPDRDIRAAAERK